MRRDSVPPHRINSTPRPVGTVEILASVAQCTLNPNSQFDAYRNQTYTNVVRSWRKVTYSKSEQLAGSLRSVSMRGTYPLTVGASIF